MSSVLKYGDHATCREECLRPDLWPDHAWVPELGPTSKTIIRDLCGSAHMCGDGVTIGQNNVSPISGTKMFSRADYRAMGPTTIIAKHQISTYATANAILTDGYYYYNWYNDTITNVLGRGYFVRTGTTSGLLSLQFTNDAGFYNYVSSAQPSLNVPHVSVALHDGSASYDPMKLYLDGTLLSGNKSYTANNTYNPATRQYFYDGYGDWDNTGPVFALYRWFRVLPEKDIKAITNDIFLPIRRRVVVYSIPFAASISGRKFSVFNSPILNSHVMR